MLECADETKRTDLTLNLDGKRVLVTGHDGFIGTYLMRELAVRGAMVFGLTGDVRDKRSWQREFDIVYHLAAASPFEFQSSPTDAFDVSINGVLRALEACAERGAHLLFASSSSLYEGSAAGPVTEEHPLKAEGSYARSKLIGETLCQDYASRAVLRCTVFRLFNVFGPGQSSKFLIPYLAECARKGTEASIRHPDSTRDFVHVKDVVRALIAGAAHLSSWEVFNVGSGQAWPVRQVVGILGQIAGSSISLNLLPGIPDPIPFSHADIAKARRCLGWAPAFTLYAGLKDVMERDFQMGN